MGWLSRTGPSKCGGVVGVDVIAVGVDVDGLAGDHHGGAGVGQQRQQPGGVGGGVADAVHEEVGPAADGGAKLGVVVPVGGHEAGPGGGQAGGHLAPVPPGQVNVPAAGQQAAADGLPDHPSPAENERPSHAAKRIAQPGYGLIP